MQTRGDEVLASREQGLIPCVDHAATEGADSTEEKRLEFTGQHGQDNGGPELRAARHGFIQTYQQNVFGGSQSMMSASVYSGSSSP